MEFDILKRDNPQKEDVQVGSPSKEEEFKTVEVVIRTFTVERLKAIARQCSVALGRKKPLLFGHIQECNNTCITKIDESKSLYKEKVEKVRYHVPVWIILISKKAGPIAGKYWHGNWCVAWILWSSKPREHKGGNEAQLLHARG